MLLIDAGNTAVKCRWLHQGENQDQVFNSRDPQFTAAFENYLKTISAETICMATVASVEMTHAVEQVLSKQLPHAQLQALVTRSELGGLKNGYRDFHQLGVDRWLALLAAYKTAGTDCIVIDAGSAITVDVLSREQGFIGGAILPGINTTVGRFKQMFPQVDFSNVSTGSLSGPGRDTQSCLFLPATRKIEDALVPLIEAWSDLLISPTKCLLTGQDAAIIGKHLPGEYSLIPDLVFQGMLHQIELLR